MVRLSPPRRLTSNTGEGSNGGEVGTSHIPVSSVHQSRFGHDSRIAVHGYTALADPMQLVAPPLRPNGGASAAANCLSSRSSGHLAPFTAHRESPPYPCLPSLRPTVQSSGLSTNRNRALRPFSFAKTVAAVVLPRCFPMAHRVRRLRLARCSLVYSCPLLMKGSYQRASAASPESSPTIPRRGSDQVWGRTAHAPLDLISVQALWVPRRTEPCPHAGGEGAVAGTRVDPRLGRWLPRISGGCVRWVCSGVSRCCVDLPPCWWGPSIWAVMASASCAGALALSWG